MKLNNIHVGQVFPNYKALCKTLEIPDTGGTVKLANMKKLETCVKLEKIGNSFKVVEFIAKTSVDSSLISSMSQRGLCELLLIDYFYRHILSHNDAEVLKQNPREVFSIVLTKRQIDLITGLVNSIFSSIKNGKSGKIECHFASKVRAKNWDIIRDVLWNIGTKKIANNYRTFYEVTIINPSPRVLPFEEVFKILDVYQSVLRNSKRSSVQQMYALKELPEYYEAVNKALYEQHQIIFHEECFVFRISLQAAEDYLLSKVISLNAMSNAKIEVNNRHVENLFNFFHRQYERFLRLRETDCQGLQTEYYDKLEETYVEHNNNCINKYIKLTA